MKNNTSFLHKVVGVLSLVFGVSILAPTMNCSADATPTPNVIPRDSLAFGRAYGDWAEAWWQWALSIPVAQHPLFDNGDCSVGQSGPVFFLGGRFCPTSNPQCDPSSVTRTCTVPADKALFFPILNAENSTLEGLGTRTAPTIVELRVASEAPINLTRDQSDR